MYIWKVKASPEHFEDTCYNPDRKKPTLFQAYLERINKNVKYQWEGTMQKYYKLRKKAKYQ